MGNYPENMVAPMREELTQAGFAHLYTPEEVDAALQQPGSTLLVLNSVCGCAAGSLRPGVIEAVRDRGVEFDHLVTVFAGMETEAVRRVREHFGTLAPSSPNVAIFVDGKLAHHMNRSTFEGNAPSQIADQIALANREI